MKKISIFIVIILLLNSSCIYKKIRYIQDKNEVFGQINEYDNRAPEYKLQISDILYIKIQSTNKEISELFDAEQANARMASFDNKGNFYLQGFSIDSSGCIVLPVLGTIKLEGLTIDQAQTKVQNKVNQLLNNTIVKVKLVSFYIDFLGEVNQQGRLLVKQDNINILDALAQIGGITDYGNRSNILIIRRTKKGTKTFHVDLTRRDLLTSDKFYMLPYDIVVVEPLRRKSFQLAVRDYSLVITTITSTITMIWLILNFKK